MSRSARGGLWAFSLRFYAQPGVEPACLALQDEHGVDVNVLLFLLWLALRGAKISKPQLEAILQASAPWQREVVAPLRRLRRRLKEPILPVEPSVALRYRKRLEKLELEAERLEQDALQAWSGRNVHGSAASAASAAEAARASLDVYADVLGCRLPEPVMSGLLGTLAAHVRG